MFQLVGEIRFTLVSARGFESCFLRNPGLALPAYENHGNQPLSLRCEGRHSSRLQMQLGIHLTPPVTSGMICGSGHLEVMFIEV